MGSRRPSWPLAVLLGGGGPPEWLLIVASVFVVDLDLIVELVEWMLDFVLDSLK